MKTIARGGLTVSAVVKRETLLPHRLTQVYRNKSTSANSEAPFRAAGNDAPSSKYTASQSHPHSSATASAGAPVPSMQEASSRSLRQILKAGPLGKSVGWYSRQQRTRPYWTQMWSTLVIYLCGDLCAQLLVSDGEALEPEKQEDEEGLTAAAQGFQNTSPRLTYDPLRTARHLTVGAVACIPVYRWFMFLHNNFNYSSKALSIFTKVAVSQAFFTPIFNTYFFSVQSLLAGASLEDTWERVKKAVPNSIMNSVKLWPGVTAVLFLYVQPQFRSIVSGIVAVGWQAYLSWLNQKAAKEVREASAIEAVELMATRSPREATLLNAS
ncbi:hypothetical protein PRK78_000353 [Emydomyces testavorans]|uniref:Uncharacterized protein n=1 Tax=Emydomyces testavorans TaxID=2070801 RepID=A0AAF0IFR5_9EURO|nr:hypothetical protein PRK78_000353 [Emydomyces testavorans]